MAYASDHFKTQEMCNEAVTHNPYVLRFISVHLKTQEMCDEGSAYHPDSLFSYS